MRRRGGRMLVEKCQHIRLSQMTGRSLDFNLLCGGQIFRRLFKV
ncbi:hypothetical protein LINPERPRIM_LOCUS40659 [Linum perenne]